MIKIAAVKNFLQQHRTDSFIGLSIIGIPVIALLLALNFTGLVPFNSIASTIPFIVFAETTLFNVIAAITSHIVNYKSAKNKPFLSHSLTAFAVTNACIALSIIIPITINIMAHAIAPILSIFIISLATASLSIFSIITATLVRWRNNRTHPSPKISENPAKEEKEKEEVLPISEDQQYYHLNMDNENPIGSQMTENEIELAKNGGETFYQEIKQQYNTRGLDYYFKDNNLKVHGLEFLGNRPAQEDRILWADAPNFEKLSPEQRKEVMRKTVEELHQQTENEENGSCYLCVVTVGNQIVVANLGDSTAHFIIDNPHTGVIRCEQLNPVLHNVRNIIKNLPEGINTLAKLREYIESLHDKQSVHYVYLREFARIYPLLNQYHMEFTETRISGIMPNRFSYRDTPSINLTRSLGDNLFGKIIGKRPDLYTYSLPEIQSNQQAHLIISCDGLLDYIRDRQNKRGNPNAIYQHIQDNKSWDAISLAKATYNQTLSKSSKDRKPSDNVSIMVAELDPKLPPRVFCVFDGHAGSTVSQHLKDHFLNVFQKNVQEFLAKATPQWQHHVADPSATQLATSMSVCNPVYSPRRPASKQSGIGANMTF